MTDREKVLSGLEHCSEDGCKGCPYEPDCKMCDGFSDLAKDALELLKKQEPVEPKLIGVNTWTCGECGALLGWEDFSQSGHCPVCGRKVECDG